MDTLINLLIAVGQIFAGWKAERVLDARFPDEVADYARSLGATADHEELVRKFAASPQLLTQLLILGSDETETSTAAKARRQLATHLNLSESLVRELATAVRSTRSEVGLSLSVHTLMLDRLAAGQRAIWQYLQPRAQNRQAFLSHLQLHHFRGGVEQTGQIRSALDAGSSVIVQGPAGVGKTALLAQLACLDGWPCFFPALSSEASHLKDFVQYLADWALDRQLLSELEYDECSFSGADDSVPYLFRTISSNLGEQTLVIAIDALDEIGSTGLGNLLSLPYDLPGNVRLLVSRRGVDPALHLRTPIETIVLRSAHSDLEAKSAYARDRLTASGMTDPEAIDLAVSEILERSEGLWVYLRHVCDDLNEGRIGPSDLADLPQGLFAYYYWWWDRRRRDSNRWHDLELPTLGALASAHGSAEVQELATVTELRPAEVLGFIMGPCAGYIYGSADFGFRLYHQTFSEFVAGVTPRGGTEFALSSEMQASTETGHLRWLALCVDGLIAREKSPDLYRQMIYHSAQLRHPRTASFILDEPLLSIWIDAVVDSDDTSEIARQVRQLASRLKSVARPIDAVSAAVTASRLNSYVDPDGYYIQAAVKFASGSWSLSTVVDHLLDCADDPSNQLLRFVQAALSQLHPEQISEVLLAVSRSTTPDVSEVRRLRLMLDRLPDSLRNETARVLIAGCRSQLLRRDFDAARLFATCCPSPASMSYEVLEEAWVASGSHPPTRVEVSRLLSREDLRRAVTGDATSADDQLHLIVLARLVDTVSDFNRLSARFAKADLEPTLKADLNDTLVAISASNIQGLVASLERLGSAALLRAARLLPIQERSGEIARALALTPEAGSLRVVEVVGALWGADTRKFVFDELLSQDRSGDGNDSLAELITCAASDNEARVLLQKWVESISRLPDLGDPARLAALLRYDILEPNIGLSRSRLSVAQQWALALAGRSVTSEQAVRASERFGNLDEFAIRLASVELGGKIVARQHARALLDELGQSRRAGVRRLARVRREAQLLVIRGGDPAVAELAEGASRGEVETLRLLLDSWPALNGYTSSLIETVSANLDALSNASVPSVTATLIRDFLSLYADSDVTVLTPRLLGQGSASTFDVVPGGPLRQFALWAATEQLGLEIRSARGRLPERADLHLGDAIDFLLWGRDAVQWSGLGPWLERCNKLHGFAAGMLLGLVYGDASSNSGFIEKLSGPDAAAGLALIDFRSLSGLEEIGSESVVERLVSRASILRYGEWMGSDSSEQFISVTQSRGGLVGLIGRGVEIGLSGDLDRALEYITFELSRSPLDVLAKCLVQLAPLDFQWQQVGQRLSEALSSHESRS